MSTLGTAAGGGDERPTLLVEGWRGINHSYAMVNQHQLLHLGRWFRLYHRDLPYYNAQWSAQRSSAGFDEPDAQAIGRIPAPAPDTRQQVCYRIGFPLRMGPAAADRLYVFGTSEWQNINGFVHDNGLRRGLRDRSLSIVTPSRWSRAGFLNAGFEDARVHVVPHGIDPARFHPIDRGTRAAVRARLGLPEDAWAVLSVGAMTANKGVDVLVLAFARLRRRHPHARLLLKDQSNLYGIGAEGVLAGLRQAHPAEIDEATLASITVITDNLSQDGLRELYGAADCYASTYRAEGFNLPPLEAAACGTPVLVTQGGPTDDYAEPDFAVQVESRRRAEGIRAWLEPDPDATLARLEDMLEARVPGLDPAAAVPRIHAGHAWASVCERLARVLRGG